MMLLALLLGVAAPTVAPKAPHVIVLPPAKSTFDPFAGMSEAGRAIVRAEMPIEAGRNKTRQARYKAAMAKLGEALKANPLDVDRLRAALAERDRVLADNRREQSEAAVALIGRLSGADRRIVGQAIIRAPGTN